MEKTHKLIFTNQNFSLEKLISLTKQLMEDHSSQSSLYRHCASTIVLYYTMRLYEQTLKRARPLTGGGSIVASRVASMPLETYEDRKEEKKSPLTMPSWLLDWKQKCGNSSLKGTMMTFFVGFFYQIGSVTM